MLQGLRENGAAPARRKSLRSKGLRQVDCSERLAQEMHLANIIPKNIFFWYGVSLQDCKKRFCLRWSIISV